MRARARGTAPDKQELTSRPDIVAKRTISEAEAKGFTSPRRKRSDAARRGWRERYRHGYTPKGRPQPRQRDRQAALALAYPAAPPSRKRLIEQYVADGGRLDGAETFALIIRQDWLLCKVRGAHAGSTGPRRAAGLAKADRPRVARTIRRHRARAMRLGIARYHHVHRQRGVAGRRDFLRVEIVNRCPPACGSNSTGSSSQCAVASEPGSQTSVFDRRPKGRERPCHSPPAAAKVPAAAPPAETAGTKEGGPGVGGEPRGGAVPECCGQVLAIDQAEDEIWEAHCERCGSEFGLPPSQQSVALLRAQAGMEPEGG